VSKSESVAAFMFSVSEKNFLVNQINKYIEEVLEPKLLPSARDIFDDGEPFIFQQDGAQ